MNAETAATTTVTKGIPLLFTAPTLSGTAKKGHALTTSNGTWRGTATITVTGYQWYRCNGVGESCVAISGATRKTYIVSASDKNHALRVRVYVKNPIGSGERADRAHRGGDVAPIRHVAAAPAAAAHRRRLEPP